MTLTLVHDTSTTGATVRLRAAHDPITVPDKALCEIPMPNYARCIRCRRVLTNKASMRRGYGRGCRAHLNRAAQQVAMTFSENQVRKAASLLRSEAISWDESEGMYRIVSGENVYWTLPDRCTCPAGENARRCYHRCAVKIRELTPYGRRTN